MEIEKHQCKAEKNRIKTEPIPFFTKQICCSEPVIPKTFTELWLMDFRLMAFFA